MNALSDVLLLQPISLEALRLVMQEAKVCVGSQAQTDLSNPIAASVLGGLVVSSRVCLKLFLVPVHVTVTTSGDVQT